MYIGIDPSLSGTAVAVYGGEVERISSEACGPEVRPRIERYRNLAHAVSVAVEDLANPPNIIFVEGYSFGSKHGGEKLAEYGGILRLQLLKRFPHAKIMDVPPSALKKFITGKGNGDKTAVIAAIASRYQVQFKTNDEYDAYALALMAAAYGGAFECTNQAQRDVIAALKNPKVKKRKGKAA
jgi:crossover junction endodeoxyribonuclease RuvC